MFASYLSIAERKLAEIQRAVQLDLPIVEGNDIPILYIEMDGTGVPVTHAETEGLPGKDGEHQAHTREVKLGCVLTQTATDSVGRPLRDARSTTYTGAIETADEFGRRMYQEACQRGRSRATKKVIVGDGAAWIWNIADREFPGALQIVDLYRAREHLWVLAGKLFSTDEKRRKRWASALQKKLDAGKIPSIVKQLRSSPTSYPEAAELLRVEADYFRTGSRTHAISRLPPPAALCRFRRHRGSLPHSRRSQAQTIRNVLDCPRCQRNHRSPLLSPQSPVRRLLVLALSPPDS